ncbi:MAG TPA: cytochrome c [Candidatus Sulfotelmatobacter sp.]|nr:cytochrome c [Candidatus Sulfotelmatobacter sp.]
MSRRWNLWIIVLALGAAGALAGAAFAADTADGQAVFAKRADTMKQMGKPFYLTIGRAVRAGKPPDPDIADAAKTVAGLAQNLTPALFAPGSAVGATKMKPEIFQDPARVAGLTDQARAAVAKLEAAAEGGDKDALAAAYHAAADACAACHKAFRNED